LSTPDPKVESQPQANPQGEGTLPGNDPGSPGLNIGNIDKALLEENHPHVKKLLQENYDFREKQRQRAEEDKKRQEQELADQNKFKELVGLKESEISSKDTEIEALKKAIKERSEADGKLVKARLDALTPEDKKRIDGVFSKANVTEPSQKLALLDELIPLSGAQNVSLPRPDGSLGKKDETNQLLEGILNDPDPTNKKKLAETQNRQALLQRLLHQK
jgi:hypothetical protein